MLLYTQTITLFTSLIVAHFLSVLQSGSLGQTIMRGNLLHNIVLINAKTLLVKKHIIIKLVFYEMSPNYGLLIKHYGKYLI